MWKITSFFRSMAPPHTPTVARDAIHDISMDDRQAGCMVTGSMMRDARSTIPIALLAIWFLGSCGVGAEGDSSYPDAGASDPYCFMGMTFAPAMPSTETDVVVTATITSSDGRTGYHSHEWLVRSPTGSEIPVTSRDPDGAQISFRSSTAGPHYIVASGALSGEQCIDAVDTINILAPDSTAIPHRLRLIPGPAQAAPAQEYLITVFTGADQALGEIPLSGGIQLAGTIQGEDGQPVPAYLRAVLEDAEDPAFVEAFADDQGTFSMHLENRSYSVLVVPSDDQHAPARFDDQRAAATWLLTLPAAATIGGSVTAPDSTPLANARVSMRTGAVPSTIATTDDTGAFTLRTHLEDALSLTVVPPAATGLPMLDLPSSAGLTGTAVAQAGIAIAYAPSLRTRTITPSARLADSTTPAPGTRAIWISHPIPDAGLVTPAGGTPLAAAGSARLTAVAGPDSTWPPLTLPEAVYDLILEPPASSGASVTLLQDIDLTTEPPPVLALAEHATIQGRITDMDGTGLAGIEVTAAPTGLLAQNAGLSTGQTAGRRTTSTAADGSFAVDLVAGGAYDLLFDSPNASHGRGQTSLVAPAPGQRTTLPALALPPARRLTGRVTSLGMTGTLSGITVQLLCAGCEAPDSTVPRAEALTDATGTFVLALPEVLP